MQRSNITEAEVKKIMAAQLSREDRQKMADDIVTNQGSLQELQQKIIVLHQKYINPCIVSN